MIVSVKPGVVVLITGHDTRANIAIVGQRALHIHDIALFIPATVFCRNVAFELTAGGMFTHHVDRRRRVTGSGHQPIRTTHHFDAFKERSIRKGVAQVPTRFKIGRDAINHVVINLETT
ncbi:hypothetical protein D3C80_947110 [compost metagenome]